MENKQLNLSEPENIMGTMDVNPLLIKLSIPMMISMLVQALYNVVDSIFVARVSENALTAVSLAFSLQNMMFAVGIGTGVGVNALLSKSLGEKNQSRANKTAENGLFLALCSYLVFLVLGLIGTASSILGHFTGAGFAIKNGSKIVRPTIIIVLILLAAKVIQSLITG